MRLDQLFPKDLFTVGPNVTLAEVAELMQDNRLGAVVVVDDGERPTGIVTDRDLGLALGTGRALRTEPVRVVMSCPVVTVGRDEGVLAVTRRFHDTGLRRLPVVDADGRLVGLVGVDDLFQLLGKEIGDLAKGVSNAPALAG